MKIPISAFCYFLFSFLLCLSVSALNQVHTLKAHALLGGDDQSYASALSLSPNTAFAAAALHGDGIYVWDTSQRSFLYRYPELGRVRAIDIDDNGNLLLSVKDRLLYREKHANEFQDIALLDFQPVDLKFVRTGFAIVASEDGYIGLWNLTEKTETRSQELGHSVRSLVTNKDRSMMATNTYHTSFSSKKNKISLFKTNDLLLTQLTMPHAAAVQLCISPTKERLALLQGQAITVRNFNLATVKEAHFCESGSMNNLMFAPDGSTIFVSTLQNKFYRLYPGDPAMIENWVWSFNNNGLNNMVFSADGRLLFTWSAADRGRLWLLPDTEFVGEDDAGNFTDPKKGHSQTDRNLKCTLSADKKSITIETYHNKSGFYSIFWRLYNSSGEVLLGSKQYEYIDGKLEIEIPYNKKTESCEAFYTNAGYAP